MIGAVKSSISHQLKDMYSTRVQSHLVKLMNHEPDNYQNTLSYLELYSIAPEEHPLDSWREGTRDLINYLLVKLWLSKEFPWPPNDLEGKIIKQLVPDWKAQKVDIFEEDEYSIEIAQYKERFPGVSSRLDLPKWMIELLKNELDQFKPLIHQKVRFLDETRSLEDNQFLPVVSLILKMIESFKKRPAPPDDMLGRQIVLAYDAQWFEIKLAPELIDAKLEDRIFES